MHLPMFALFFRFLSDYFLYFSSNCCEKVSERLFQLRAPRNPLKEPISAIYHATQEIGKFKGLYSINTELGMSQIVNVNLYSWLQ